jgi:hypothetical protein
MPALQACHLQDLEGTPCKLPEASLRKTFRMRPRNKIVQGVGSALLSVEADLLAFQQRMAAQSTEPNGTEENRVNPENADANEGGSAFGAHDSLADLKIFQRVYANLADVPARQNSVAPTPRSKNREERKMLGEEALFSPPSHSPTPGHHRTPTRIHAHAHVQSLLGYFPAACQHLARIGYPLGKSRVV